MQLKKVDHHNLMSASYSAN